MARAGSREGHHSFQNKKTSLETREARATGALIEDHGSGNYMSDSEVKSMVLKMEQMEPNVQQVCERVSSSMSVGKARPASPTTD